MFVNILLLECVLYLIYVLLGIIFMLEHYAVLGIREILECIDFCYY